jgi:hypothetical protein
MYNERPMRVLRVATVDPKKKLGKCWWCRKTLWCCAVNPVVCGGLPRFLPELREKHSREMLVHRNSGCGH